MLKIIHCTKKEARMKKYYLLIIVIAVSFSSCILSMNSNLVFQAIGRAQTTADTAEQKAQAASQKVDENKAQIEQLIARVAALEAALGKK